MNKRLQTVHEHIHMDVYVDNTKLISDGVMSFSVYETAFHIDLI